MAEGISEISASESFIPPEEAKEAEESEGVFAFQDTEEQTEEVQKFLETLHTHLQQGERMSLARETEPIDTQKLEQFLEEMKQAKSDLQKPLDSSTQQAKQETTKPQQEQRSVLKETVSSQAVQKPSDKSESFPLPRAAYEECAKSHERGQTELRSKEAKKPSPMQLSASKSESSSKNSTPSQTSRRDAAPQSHFKQEPQEIKKQLEGLVEYEREKDEQEDSHEENEWLIDGVKKKSLPPLPGGLDWVDIADYQARKAIEGLDHPVDKEVFESPDVQLLLQHLKQTDPVLSRELGKEISYMEILLLFFEILKMYVQSRAIECQARRSERQLQIERMMEVSESYSDQGSKRLFTGIGGGVLMMLGGFAPILGYTDSGSWLKDKIGGLIGDNWANLSVPKFYERVSEIVKPMGEQLRAGGEIHHAFSMSELTISQMYGEIHGKESDEKTRTREQYLQDIRGIDSAVLQIIQMQYDSMRMM